MAKDGTNRGGARVGAGRKKKPLSEKINNGKDAKVLSFEELSGSDMPQVKDYMKAKQKNGEAFIAQDVFKDTWTWLK